MVPGTLRLIAIVSVLTALVSATVSGARDERVTDRAGSFVVEQRGGNFTRDPPTLTLRVGFGAPPLPGRLTIYIPRGFALDSDDPAGTPVGFAELFLTEGLQAADGTIATAPLDAARAAEGRSCSGREPIAGWLLHLALGKRRIDVPVFVSSATTGDPANADARLDLCLSPLASLGDGRVPAVFGIALAFDGFLAPMAPGGYVWRAVVTPVGSDERGLRPGSAYELRATVPVPQRLTLSGRYLARDETVTLTGSLQARGRVRARVPIEVVRLDRVVTERGVVVRDATVALVATSVEGRYSVRMRARRTAGYLARAWPVGRTCQQSALAPAGCVSATVAGAESDPITISIP
jgi:hypothetical protein